MLKYTDLVSSFMSVFIMYIIEADYFIWDCIFTHPFMNTDVRGMNQTVLESKASSPGVLLRSMSDHEVDEDGPEVCAFRVARQDFVKHGATFLCITITELQLSKLADDIHT